MPFDSFAKIIRHEVIWVVALRNDGFVRFSLVGKVVVNADEDGFLDAHVKGELQREVGDCGSFPHPPAHIIRESRSCVGGVDEGWERRDWRLGIGDWGLETGD